MNETRTARDDDMVALNAALRQRDQWRERAKDAERMVALLVRAAGGEVRIPPWDLDEEPPEVLRMDDPRDLSIMFRVEQ